MPIHSTQARIIALAKLGAAAFETAKRQNGETFVRTKDDAQPDWLHDVCREAHNGMFPDDMKYEMIRNAFDRLADCSEDDDLSDVAHEFADAEPDSYNAGLSAWLASNLTRAAYVDDAIGEYGAPEPFDQYKALAMGWYAEAREVFDIIVRELETIAEDQEDDPTATDD